MILSHNRFHAYLPLALSIAFIVIIHGAYAQPSPLYRYEKLLTDIESLDWSEDRCIEINHELTSEVQKLGKPSRADAVDVQKRGRDILERSFLSRVYIRKQLERMHERGTLTEPCAVSFKVLFRHLRGAEDYISRLSILSRNEVSIGPKYNGFLPLDTNMARGKPEEFEVRSGDIMISRGNAPTSAAISRLGDIDAQFSHLGLIYIDEKTKKAYTIEAHIEIGVVVAPLSDWFKDGKSRTALYRYKGSAKVAHEAAKKMYLRTLSATNTGENIHYDFAMDMNDHKDLFCSEVAKAGFEGADRNLVFPIYPSIVKPKNRYFLELLGIKATRAFLPADMEIEPQFEFLAEWRAPTRIHKVWKKDAVLTKMFEWMESKSYRFDFNAFHALKMITARSLRRLGFLKKDFQLYIPKSTMQTIFVLDPTVEELENYLDKKENENLKNMGLPYTYFEMLGLLENLRIEKETNHKPLTRYFKHKSLILESPSVRPF